MSRLFDRSGIALRCLVLGFVLSGFMAAMLVAQPMPEGSETPPATQPAMTPPTTPPADPEASTQEAAADNTEAAPDRNTGNDPQPPRQPTPAEILRELTRTGGENKGVVLPDRPERRRPAEPDIEAQRINAIAPLKPKLLPDGYRLVDRPGRLAQHEGYWMFSFESRGRGTPEMPIRLLPNRLLEDMEEFSAGGTKDIVFIVSGEVTEYRGVNYLLIQKLLTRPSVGNLQ